MKTFIASFPVFDEKVNVKANFLSCKDVSSYTLGLTSGGDTATMSDLQVVQELGVHAFTAGKPLYCPVNRVSIFSSLLEEMPHKELMTLVIPFGIDITDAYLRRMSVLVRLGFRLAIDGYSVLDEARLRALSPFADAVIVDFHNTAKQTWEHIHNNTGTFTVIIKNIATRQEFALAQAFKASLFMGSFYTLPFSREGRVLAPLQMNSIRLLKLAGDEEYSIDELASVVSLDPALSFDLLKLINSAAFGFRNKVSNIRSAIVALGQNEFRKWVSYSCVRALSVDAPTEVMRVSLIRARFMERLSLSTGLAKHTAECFLTGLFSIMEAVLNRSMRDVLEDIAVSEEIRNALIYRAGPYADILSAVLDYERGDWVSVSRFLILYGIKPDLITDGYLTSLRWVTELTNESQSQP